MYRQNDKKHLRVGTIEMEILWIFNFQAYPPWLRGYMIVIMIIQACQAFFQALFYKQVNSSKNSILNWVMRLNLFMSISFEKPLILRFSTLFNYSSYSLAEILTNRLIPISFMYLSWQHFFKTPHKTLKFQQKLLLLQTKKYISKHDRMEVFSQLIFNNAKAMPLQSERVSTQGIPHGDSELCKL